MPNPTTAQSSGALRKSARNFMRKVEAETAAELDALLPALLDCAFKGIL